MIVAVPGATPQMEIRSFSAEPEPALTIDESLELNSMISRTGDSTAPVSNVTCVLTDDCAPTPSVAGGETVSPVIRRIVMFCPGVSTKESVKRTGLRS